MRSNSTVVSLINAKQVSTFFHFDEMISVRLTENESVTKFW